LREAEREAEQHGDKHRLARAREEIEALARELSAGMGLGGRGRKASSVAERARVNIQRRIQFAIRQIEEHDPALAQYLRWTIRTGTFCCYRPPLRNDVPRRVTPSDRGG